MKKIKLHIRSNIFWPKLDCQSSVNSEHSDILKLLDKNIIAKMREADYRIIVSIIFDDFQTYLLFEDLSAGIEGLLNWEYCIKEEYNLFDNGQNQRSGRIAKATIFFEDELQNGLSAVEHSEIKGIYYELMEEFNEIRYFDYRTSYALELFRNSSEILSYLDDSTLYDIGNDGRFYIYVTVSFGDSERVTIVKELQGLGDLLLFERYILLKCDDWEKETFCINEDNQFRYEKIEIAMEI